MTTIIVLFNLKSDADREAYEQWAKNTDLPTVRGLDSCDGFTVYKTTGLLGGGQAAPYQYVEKIEVNDMGRFGTEVKTDLMQAVAAEFQAFADQPVFMLSENLEQ